MTQKPHPDCKQHQLDKGGNVFAIITSLAYILNPKKPAILWDKCENENNLNHGGDNSIDSCKWYLFSVSSQNNHLRLEPEKEV